MKRAALPLFPLAAILLAGCPGVYFNTTFNAEKAHAQALKLRAERLEKNPEDTIAVTGDERAKLNRAVTKASKVLELWPNDPKYAPRAVFLIAESQFLMEDYASAALKYEEYLRYFPDGEHVPMARVRLARALYLDGKRLAAREALDEVLASGPRGEVRREALLLAARMRIDEQAGAEGLAVYEQLLEEGAFPSPEGRNEARWRAAVIASGIDEWEKARTLALAASEGTAVPARTRMRNHRMGLEALLRLGRHAEALEESRELQSRREYRPYRPDLKVFEARALAGTGPGPHACTGTR
jgi:tetratricopeptide (TPR) repeat protein